MGAQLKRNVMRFGAGCEELMRKYESQMERLFLAFLGGTFIPISLFLITAIVGEFLELRMGMEWAVNLLVYSFMGPLKIWTRVFPPPTSCGSCGPTKAAVGATVVTIFLFYSILTYLIQMVIARFRRNQIALLAARRA
jgi:hypothetical protein